MGGLVEEYLPAMAMFGLQVTYAIMALLSRAALMKGMSPRVFVVYRQAIATLFIAPIAYFSRFSPQTFIFFLLGSLFFCVFSYVLGISGRNQGGCLWI